MILSESRRNVKPIYYIMVKKIRRKVKKIAMKASLINMELEDLTEENESQKKQLSKDFADEFEFLDWKRRGSKRADEPEPELPTDGHDGDDSGTPKKEVPPEIKKLYRQIALNTHPDKFEDEYLNDVFTQAATAIEQENWMLLVELAGELKLDIGFLSDETCEMIEKSIEKSESEIDAIKGSFSYMWAKQRSDKDKELFTLLFYRQFQISEEEFKEWLKERKDKKS